MDSNIYDTMYELEMSHWWFTSRRKILERLCRPTKTPGLRILDVGCGCGGNLEFLDKIGSVEGLDFSSIAVEYCSRRNFKVTEGSAEDLPYDSNSFGVVTALDVLEHLDDDGKAITEIFRVTTPGGRIIATVPAFASLWSGHDVAHHHRRRYHWAELRDKIRQSGFDIVKLSYFNSFLFPLIVLRRRLAKMSGNPASDTKKPFAVSNLILETIFKSEAWFLPYLNFPFGVSIVCIARKPCE